jgi:hypothetical protein
MGKRKGRSAKKVPRPAKRQATRSLKDLPSDYVVYTFPSSHVTYAVTRS